MAITDADLVILLGNRLCLFTVTGSFFNGRGENYSGDIEPEEIGPYRAIDLAGFGDIRALLKECKRIVAQRRMPEACGRVSRDGRKAEKGP